MAGAPEAEEGTEVAMDVHMSLTTPVFSFSFSVKIADKLLAAGAIVGGVTLAVLVSQQPERVADAVRSVLQAPGLAVQSIMPGSILVSLKCNKAKSFLLFIERFETGIVKQQLEEQFKKLGLEGEIEVTLVNSREWYQEIDQIRLCVGVDVGETNTDAVILLNKEILCSTKVLTTWEVTSGIVKAISSATKQLPRALQKNRSKHIARVNIGTTHFVNAIVQRKNLAKVAVLRLCAQATTAIPPLCDFPDDLKNVIGGMHFFLSGGYQYNGTCIADVDEEEVRTTTEEVKKAGIKNVVVVGVFSPVSGKQEDQVGAIIKSVCPDMSITLSHEVGLIGLLERENAAVLNESLKPLCHRTVKAFCGALNQLGLKCPLYLTQNDGTIISAERIRHLPVYTFASGPTNSMRGAAFLSATKDAIVIDIGGTTTDVGLIKGGFPKQASTRVKIGGVSTNFRMPDVLSIQLGGGSVVQKNGEITVGPRSVGYKLTSEALVFEGGNTMTSTDIAVASGFCDNIGDKERVKHIPEEVRTGSLKFIKKKIEAAIDRVKISKDDQLVILVGGGSILANPEKSQTLKGASKVVCPEYYQVANAVGAALSEVSGTFDQVISMDNTTREDARTYAEKEAKRKAVEAGADEKTLEVIDVVEVPLAYLPGNAVRYYLKVIGDLKEIYNSNSQEAFSGGELSKVELTDEPSCFDQAPVSSDRFCDQGDAIVFKEPYIDPATGDWILNKFDIECISIGAGILGCGGGGSPYLGRLRTLELLKAGKEIRIIHPNKLGSSPSLTGPVGLTALMGAPMIDLEKLFSGRESNSALEAVQTILFNGDKVKEKTVTDGIRITEDVQLLEKAQPSHPHKTIVAVVCGDVGGINSMEPLAIGAERGLPIVDADGVGRAFPELQMFLPFVYGSPPYPAAIGDEKGNVIAVAFANSPKSLEDFFREKTIEMGCTSGFAVGLDWKDVKEKCVPYSLSRVWRLGNSVLRAKHKKVSPVNSILQHENGKVLIAGKIADVHRATEGGFNKGSLIIEGSARFSGIKLNIDFQNENYVAFTLRSDGSKDVLATVPDLISLVDENTGQPIITEEVRYGLRVAAIASPCFPQWATPQGLATVGPAVFGYQDVVYNPVNVYKKHPPIPVARN